MLHVHQRATAPAANTATLVADALRQLAARAGTGGERAREQEVIETEAAVARPVACALAPVRVLPRGRGVDAAKAVDAVKE